MIFRELLDLHGAVEFVHQYEYFVLGVIDMNCIYLKSLQNYWHLDE